MPAKLHYFSTPLNRATLLAMHMSGELADGDLIRVHGDYIDEDIAELLMKSAYCAASESDSGSESDSDDGSFELDFDDDNDYKDNYYRNENIFVYDSDKNNIVPLDDTIDYGVIPMKWSYNHLKDANYYVDVLPYNEEYLYVDWDTLGPGDPIHDADCDKENTWYNVAELLP